MLSILFQKSPQKLQKYEILLTSELFLPHLIKYVSAVSKTPSKIEMLGESAKFLATVVYIAQTQRFIPFDCGTTTDTSEIAK